MKILHLTLKKKWFDMELSGEKPEEYRDIKPYWIKRLVESMSYDVSDPGSRDIIYNFKHFDAINFTNGYGKNAPSFLIKLKKIQVGEGKVKWGAEPDKEYFVLQLGEIIK